MSTIRRIVRARARGDEGVGLILVIGISIFVFTLAATAVAYSVNGISQSRNRTSFEKSLATAESGIDFTLSKLQTAFTNYNRDYPVPSPPDALVEPAPWCDAPVVDFPAAPADGANGIFSSEDAERSWARAQIDALRGVSNCIQNSADGQYIVLKPRSPLVTGPYPKAGKVYSLSALPSFNDPHAHFRLVKSEYVFMPYRPTHAVLTSGPVAISSSTTVTAAYGVDPAEASIHSNATVSGTGNPTVTGVVSSTGASSFRSNNFASNPGGTVSSLPVQAIPKVNANNFYFQAVANDSAAITDWYDLCPDGFVRPYSTSGPCTAVTSIGNAATTQVRGWTYNSTTHLWTATPNILSGTYYALRGNITAGTANIALPKLTLVAEAENAADCTTKRYGNIDWDHYNIGAPAYHNLWMYADADIWTHSNFSAGSGITAPPVVSGMFVAGDQINMETSSQGAVGSVVSANQCSTPPALPVGLSTTSEVKNPAIYYDPNSDAPFTSVITTSLWLDYSGG